jgi:hypothetical protein
MALRKRPTKDTTYGYRWQCIFGQCPKRLTTKTIRAGSFFERSRLPLAKLVYLMHLWSDETTVKSAADTIGVSQKNIVQLYQYMRDVCSTKLLSIPPDLGGPGVVQIDESLFNHKSKYQRGRWPDRETWVFGIADTSVFKKGAKSKPENYRPISLTCILSKVLEHIIVSSIMNHLDNHNLLYPLQHGFRSKLSC